MIDSDELIELSKLAETDADFAEIDRLTALLKGKTDDRWNLRTLSDVAEFFGLAIQTVKQWRIESPPMPGTEGKWPLQQIVAWRHAKLSNSDVVAAKKQADLELTQIAVEAKRMDLDKEKMELLRRDDVEYTLAHACIEARESFMGIADQIANMMAPDVREFVRAEIDKVVRSTLKQFKRNLEVASIDSDDGPVEQPTEAKDAP